MSRVRTGIVVAVCIAALIVLSIWPAIYNGQPFFSPDTSAYVRGFDAGIVWLTGKTSDWTTWAVPGGVGSNLSDQSGYASFQSPGFILAGRSVSYGALLYLGHLLGGLWATIIVQAATVVVAVVLTLRCWGVLTWSVAASMFFALAFASSLPFFASFLLPDIFAGLSILAVGNLLTQGDRMIRWEHVFWVLVLAAAVVFHPTHLAIVLVLLAASIIFSIVKTTVSFAGVLFPLFAVIIGFVSEGIFAQAVERITGSPVVRPPVVMARLIADGPGAKYLRENCPQAGFTVCRFLDRIEPVNSDAFLWSGPDAGGVYTPADVSTRRELSAEQFRFLGAVIAYDPFGELAAIFRNTAQQMKMVWLSDFSDAPDTLPLPPAYADRLRATAAWNGTFPVSFFSAVTIAASILSFSYICFTLLRTRSSKRSTQRIFSTIMLIGFVANAVICATLSGPHDRYQARLTWILPLTALLFLSTALQEQRAGRLERSEPRGK